MSLVVAKVKYLFNMNHTAVTDADPVNPIFVQFPNAQPKSTVRHKLGTYQIVKDTTPNIINAFCQLFAGKSKYPNDAETRRLDWLEQILNLLINEVPNLTSIAFPTGLSDLILMKIENFAKKYYSIHSVKILIFDYLGQTLVDFNSRITPNYYHNQKLIPFHCSTQIPYQVIGEISRDKLLLRQPISDHQTIRTTNLSADMVSSSETPPQIINNHLVPSLEKPPTVCQLTTTLTRLPASSSEKNPETKTTNKEPVIEPIVVPSAVAVPSTDVPPTAAVPSTAAVPEAVLPQLASNINAEIISSEISSNRLSGAIKSPDESINMQCEAETGDKPVTKRKVRILSNKYVTLFQSLEKSWPILVKQPSLEIMQTINQQLVKLINHEMIDVLPYPYHQTFRAFELTSWQDLKVVILGQDPYFSNKNEANGLAFSVNDGVKLPPTLCNIFKELSSDLGKPENPATGDLSNWAKQGVLLLNTSLTVVHKQSGSHLDFWKPLIDWIIQQISEQKQNLVFILWGNHAKAYKIRIAKKHYIIESSHPSPLSATRGFFGSKPFSTANQYLKSHGLTEINW